MKKSKFSLAKHKGEFVELINEIDHKTLAARAAGQAVATAHVPSHSIGAEYKKDFSAPPRLYGINKQPPLV